MRLSGKNVFGDLIFKRENNVPRGYEEETWR